jgi:hypothetical protein
VWEGERGKSGDGNGFMKFVYDKGTTQKIQLLKVRILSMEEICMRQFPVIFNQQTHVMASLTIHLGVPI